MLPPPARSRKIAVEMRKLFIENPPSHALQLIQH
jgi:hypothetical protein